MNYKSVIAAFVGAFLMSAQPAFGQASVGPEVNAEQEILLASVEAEPGVRVDAGVPVSTRTASDECSVPIVLAESAYAVGCGTSTREFLARLQRSDACGEGARHPIGDACAVVMYVLDERFLNSAFMREHKLLPTWSIRIGSVSHPTDVAETVVTTLASNSYETKLAPGDIGRLLVPIRVNNRVVEYDQSGTGTRPDQSVNLYDLGVRYYPALLIPRGKASEIMSRDAVKAHFGAPVQIVQDLEKLLNPRCLIYKLSC